MIANSSIGRTLLVLVTSQLLFATSTSGQDCTTLPESIRGDWERDVREQRSIVESVTREVRDAGGESPGGLVVIDTDVEQPKTSVQYVDLDLPDSVFLRMRGLLAAYLQERPVEKRNLVLEFGSPAVPLDTESIESCPPRLQDEARIRSLASLVLGEGSSAESIEESPAADLRVLVDSEGSVRHATLARSTGDGDLDARLVALGRQMTFAPARVNDTPVPTWTSPTWTSPTFGTRFQAREREPRLLNHDHIARLLEQAYPDEAREEGAGSRVVLWLRVSASGDVAETSVQHADPGRYRPDFIRAARWVARRMDYEPAQLDGEPVEVWLAQPITFTAR